jgi:DNA polymerase III sliding clamp (beta) subunit (PCNA family)
LNFKIETSKLSYILSKVSAGVGRKYTQPITECLYINLTDGTLLLRSTNGVNFVSGILKDVQGESGECVVKADMLIKLIEKTTKSDITVILKENHLEIKGNGTHKVPVLLESFPTYEFDANVPQFEINTDVLKRMFKVNESAIAKELIVPYLTGYNIGETCVTTDGIKMCLNNTPIIAERVLITQALADLISKTFTSDVVTVMKENNKLLIRSENLTVFGTELDGLALYPNIAPIMEYVYDNIVSVSKLEILNIISRLELFVDEFDNNGIRLTFEEDTIEIEDLKVNSQESIEYIDKKHTESGSVILLNIGFFKDIVSVISGDVVVIQYMDGFPIKIQDNDVTLFLTTMNVVTE